MAATGQNPEKEDAVSGRSSQAWLLVMAACAAPAGQGPAGGRETAAQKSARATVRPGIDVLLADSAALLRDRR
ncbi:MAG TPA: hypothetical protein VFM14_05045, partial [Gemmatimonadales bacterium]|nr:hypothetical protein [Gemmatimonadales bacterium]